MPSATFEFSGSNVLVTGGTSGIGHAIATAFTDAGAKVAVSGTRSSADDYDVDLAAFTYHSCDLTDSASVDALLASLGEVDFLINNAGAFILGTRDEWDPDAFAETVALNFTGPMRLTVGCRERLQASGHGAVVNLSSLAALRTVPELPGYSSAKAAMIALTANIARRWVRDGIRVNAVVPGLVETPMSKGVPGSSCLMGRAGRPQEIAATVLFLCSDAASYITGTALLVDGGNATR